MTSILAKLKCVDEILNKETSFSGWVRTVRESSTTLGFCNINDGSNVKGLQIVISNETMNESLINEFFSQVNIGMFLTCHGKLIESVAKGQDYELQMSSYTVNKHTDEQYPLSKTKMNLDTLRNHIHLRSRTNTFGSVFRIRSSLMKILHDFYHSRGYLHLDPNVITVNECEGGAGVFQLTENNINDLTKLSKVKDTNMYDWKKDHFCRPAYLTVSSQLQLEAMACSLGNVYTMNKSFRSEHSSTSKHVSEFTHLEIEIINNTLDDLMDVAESTVRFSIDELFMRNYEDLENLNNFISKGLIDRLRDIRRSTFVRIKYCDVIDLINRHITDMSDKQLGILQYGDDLSSAHENFITHKFNSPVFVTHWPFKIKSFYMKQCKDGSCESFDLLMPYGIGELIGASQREDDYNLLINAMKEKDVNIEEMSFYIDLRKYGSCPHGGFGMGFDRLLMLVTGMTNIKDVIPFPVFYKSCKY